MKNRGFLIVICSMILFAAPGALAEPLPDKAAAGDVVMVTDFTADDKGKSAPAGWELERKTGKPVLRIEGDGKVLYLNMVSDKSSFGIKKEVRVNIKEYPFLNWTWKVRRLPPGGDVRNSDTDDQAIQIYVVFPSTGFPARLNTPVLGYIWDNEAPKGWTGRSPQTGAGRVRYLVVRDKTDKIDEWQTEKRNIYADYRKLFGDIEGGEPTGPTQGVSLYINSQHTGSVAESLVGNVFFSRQ